MSAVLSVPASLFSLVEAALAAGATVEALRPGSWQVFPVALKGVAVRASVADDFLCFRADVPPAVSQAQGNRRATPAGWWRLLELNARLPGLAKFAHDRAEDTLKREHQAGKLSLRAEIPLDKEADLQRRIAQVWAGFHTGLDLLSNEDDPRALTATLPAADDPTDLGPLCAETGWPFTVRGDGHCSVTLETQCLSHAARVGARGRCIRVSTDLAVWDALAPLSREAVAGFLLEANALLRMARATVAEEEDTVAARLETALEWPVSSNELSAALAALSVGCELCPAHLELLQDEGAAQDFLAVRGGPRAPGNKPNIERQKS